MYTWSYQPPDPVEFILAVVFTILGIIILLYVEYKRRKRKKAMEKYAQKRMRRKFKQGSLILLSIQYLVD